MTRTVLLIVLFLTCSAVGSTFGQTTTAAAAPITEQTAKPASKAVPVAELAKPTAMPDRVILTLIGDSATERAVTWRTSVDVRTPMAEIGVADATPDFPGQARQIKAITQPLKTDLNEALFHSVRFVGLSPATTYAYRVGDGDNWSEWHQFKTAASKAEPFSFIYFGDAQNNLRSMWSRVVRQAFRQAPQAAFLLHAGDLVNSAQADEEWGQWFTAGSWVNAVMPNVAIPGNHEQFKREDGTRRLSHHWRTQFELPLNGPAGLEETCFTFVYHNTRFVALNSNEQLDVQAKWLDDLLEKDNSTWVICAFHHPIYSTAKDRDNPQLRATWKPIFDKHRVDLVLQGHDHSYGRTGFEVPEKIELPPKENAASANPTATNGAAPAKAVGPTGTSPAPSTPHATVTNLPTGLQKMDENAGTIYVVSVSGPKMYLTGRQSFMRRLAEDFQLYQVIHIDGEHLRFEARTAVGELYDAFELHKRPGERNQLVEIEAEVPQHLRPDTPKVK